MGEKQRTLREEIEMKKKLHFPISWTCFVLFFVFMLGFIVLMGNAQAEGYTVKFHAQLKRDKMKQIIDSVLAG